jgi:prepilin-type N-terminal cleavage/methylation domain-containing protein
MQAGQESRAGNQEQAMHLRKERAFTLLEVMMVVAILGLMMAIGVPAILRTMHQGPLRKAVNDVMTICYNARAQAILHGVTTCVVFRPRSGEIMLSGVAAPKSTDGFTSPEASSGENAGAPATASALNSTKFDDSIIIDMLDVNLSEYKDASEARVRFFPDGTSDEMTLIIHSVDQYRKMTLEVTTGLVSVEAIQ